MEFPLAPTSSFVKTAASSDTIPLPKSHISRTPSDLHLSDDMLRADYYEKQMYVRLVFGMQLQILREYFDNDVVHPNHSEKFAMHQEEKAGEYEELMTLHDDHHTHQYHSVVKEMVTSSSAQEGAGHQASVDTSNPKTTTSSNSLPLPKSHIHRTQSEMQLAHDMHRAECHDDRMYTRIVVGMQSRILQEYSVNGVVHSLTLRSFRGVKKTKQANDEELMKMHDHQRTHRNHSVVEEMMSSSSSQGSAGYQASMDTSTNSFLNESSGNDQDDDDCIFNLEF